jgi:hypothetical protein
MSSQPAPAAAPPADPMSAPFVISLASEARPQTSPLEPIPKTTTKTLSGGPRTSVLAVNDELEWSGNIGDDAELLALAKASGAHPSSTRRALLLVGVVVLIGAVLSGAMWGPEIKATIDRALSGKKLRDGAILVKSNPSGAKVILDGEEVGMTNLKLTAVDPDANHQLVVEPAGMDPIMIEFGPDDFVQMEDLPTYIWDKDFSKPAAPADAGPPDAGPKVEAKKKKPRKKRRGRRSRRRR